MPFWNIEGLKIVVVQFHIRSFNHFESQTREDIDNFIQSLGDRMLLPDWDLPARKRHIDLLPL